MQTGNETLVRFEQAEKHRDGVRFKGSPRDTKVRITRYVNGVVDEIIERHIKTDEKGIRKTRKGRGGRRAGIKNFPSKTARTRAKLAKAKRVKRDAARLVAAEPALYSVGPKAAREPFDVEAAYGVDVDGNQPVNFNLYR